MIANTLCYDVTKEIDKSYTHAGKGQAWKLVDGACLVVVVRTWWMIGVQYGLWLAGGWSACCEPVEGVGSVVLVIEDVTFHACQQKV